MSVKCQLINLLIIKIVNRPSVAHFGKKTSWINCVIYDNFYSNSSANYHSSNNPRPQARLTYSYSRYKGLLHFLILSVFENDF